MSTAITAMKKAPNATTANESTKIKSSNKRPRAPIACFRCHHKKVRCDGIHPNCTRCLSTGVLCAYPSSRRSRTTQPTNVDPFIDNLSHLEARIRQIESDLANQRSMVHSIVNSPISNESSDLESKMIKTELEVQDSRSILAQLRLRGEQRISRSKRAAAAAAAAAAATTTTTTATTTATANAATTISNSISTVNSSLSLPLTKEEKAKNKQLNTKSFSNRATPKSSISSKPKQVQQQSHRATVSSYTKTKSDDIKTTTEKYTTSTPSFYFQDMMLDNNTDIDCYDQLPPGHGMDWTLFDQQDNSHNNNNDMHSQVATATTMMSSSSSSSLFPPNTMTLSEHDNSMIMFHHQHQQQQQQQDQTMLGKSPLSTSRSSSLTSNLSSYPVILQPSNSTNSVNSNATALSSTTSCTSMSSAACDNIFSFSMEDMVLYHHHNEQQDIQMLPNNNNAQVWYYQQSS